MDSACHRLLQLVVVVNYNLFVAVLHVHKKDALKFVVIRLARIVKFVDFQFSEVQ